MKTYQMKAHRLHAQAGFTLIELIVVIVILGILAATALPKFAGLNASARLASLNAAKGSLRSTVAMARARYLANTSGTPLIAYTTEGSSSTYLTGVYYLGYPVGTDTSIATMAGLTSADYTIVANSTGTALQADATKNIPAIAAGQIVVIPNSIAGTPTALTCFISYTQSLGATASTTPAPTSGVVSDVPGFLNATTSSDGTNPC